MSLERHLVLNRWLSRQLGADGIDELKGDFQALEPGIDGETPYLRALLERDGVELAADRLPEYDGRIREYETRLAEARGDFAWKYFQYLALLCRDLSGRTHRRSGRPPSEPQRHLRELRPRHPHLDDFPEFTAADLRRLALFMATGSGKTLLMHANLWQVFHYLEHGRHAEALIDRADGRSEFDNVLLVTPGEGLSEQHMKE